MKSVDVNDPLYQAFLAANDEYKMAKHSLDATVCVYGWQHTPEITARLKQVTAELTAMVERLKGEG